MIDLETWAALVAAFFRHLRICNGLCGERQGFCDNRNNCCNYIRKML